MGLLLLLLLCVLQGAAAQSTVTLNSTVNLGSIVTATQPRDAQGNLLSLPVTYLLQPGVYSTGTCGMNFVALGSYTNVTLQGAGSSPEDTVIVCTTGATFTASVASGFTFNLKNIYMFKPYGSTNIISVAGSIFTENVTFGGRANVAAAVATNTSLQMSVVAVASSAALTPASIPGTSDVYYSFTSLTSTTSMNSITFSDETVADVLIVGGGGSGGSRYGGGGGAGALIYIQGYKFSAGTYFVGVGAGGASVTAPAGTSGVGGTSGGDSFIAREGVDILRAKGGGGGSACFSNAACYAGLPGGSSGGSPGGYPYASAAPLIFNVPGGMYGSYGGAGSAASGSLPASAYAAGGGGGAGSPGGDATLANNNATAGNGGSGLVVNITGSPVAYAAGGGGGCSADSVSPGWGGGAAVGGAGSRGAAAALAGAASTGSGGGGGGYNGSSNGASGAGGSGIVIIRFSTMQRNATSGLQRQVSTGCTSNCLYCWGTSNCTLTGTTTFEALPTCASSAFRIGPTAPVLVTGDLSVVNLAQFGGSSILASTGSAVSSFNIRNFVARGVVGSIVGYINSASGAGSFSFVVAGSTLVAGNILTSGNGLFWSSIQSAQSFSSELGGTSVAISYNYVTNGIFSLAQSAPNAPGSLPQLSMRPSATLEISHNMVGQTAVSIGGYSAFAIDTPASVDARFYNNTVYSASTTYPLVSFSGTSRMSWNILGNLTFAENQHAAANNLIYVALGSSSMSSNTVAVGGVAYAQPRSTSAGQRFLYVDGGTGTFVGRFNDFTCIGMYGCLHLRPNGASAYAEAHISGQLNASATWGDHAFYVYQGSAAAPRWSLLNITGPYAFVGNTYSILRAESYANITISNASAAGVVSGLNGLIPGANYPSFFRSASAPATITWSSKLLTITNNSIQSLNAWMMCSAGGQIYFTVQAVNVSSSSLNGAFMSSASSGQPVFSLAMQSVAFSNSYISAVMFSTSIGTLNFASQTVLFSNNTLSSGLFMSITGAASSSVQVGSLEISDNVFLASSIQGFMAFSTAASCNFTNITAARNTGRSLEILQLDMIAAAQPTTCITVNGLVHIETVQQAGINSLLSGRTTSLSPLDITLNDVTCIGCVQLAALKCTSASCVLRINGLLTVAKNGATNFLYALQTTPVNGSRSQVFVNGNYNLTQNPYPVFSVGQYSDAIFSSGSSGYIADNSAAQFSAETATSSIVLAGTDLVFRRNTWSGYAFSFVTSSSKPYPSTFLFSGTVLAETDPSAAASQFISFSGSSGTIVFGGNNFIARGFQSSVISVQLTGTAFMGRATFAGYFEISDRLLATQQAIFLAQNVPTANTPGNVSLELAGFYNFTNNAMKNSVSVAPVMTLFSNIVVNLVGVGGVVDSNKINGGPVIFDAYGGANNVLLFGSTADAALPSPPASAAWPALLPILGNSFWSLAATTFGTNHLFTSNNASYMTSCVPGTVVFNSSATTCMQNNSGTQLSCSASPTMQTCTICSGGTIIEPRNRTSCIREPCVPGYYYANSTAGCTACPAGTFSSSPWASACSTCLAGTYSGPAGGNTACTACQPGTYAPANGSTACISCPPGSYAPATAEVACTPCPGGRYQPAEGASSCMICPTGTASKRMRR